MENGMGFYDHTIFCSKLIPEQVCVGFHYTNIFHFYDKFTSIYYLLVNWFFSCNVYSSDNNLETYQTIVVVSAVYIVPYFIFWKITDMLSLILSNTLNALNKSPRFYFILLVNGIMFYLLKETNTGHHVHY